MTLSKQSKNILAIFAIASALALIVAWSSAVYARVSSPRGDEVVASEDAMDNVLARLVLVAETTATSTSLVDLSDESGFPHIAGSAIEVSKIIVNWTTNVIATTTLKFGVIASSTPTGNLVDVYWFDELSFTTSNLDGTAVDQPGRQQRVLDYSPSVVKLDIASGLPNSFLANDSLTLDSTFATTTRLISPNGYIALGVGDLVMRVYDQKGTATTSATVLYRVR